MKSNRKRSESWYVLLLISVAIILMSLLTTDIFWMPLLFASILTIVLLLISIWVRIQFVLYYSLAILAIGGIIGSSVVTDNGGVLSGSIVVLGMAVIGIIVSSLLKTPLEGNHESGKLNAILEAVQMSENAKRVLFRDRELSILRNTVQEDIARGEFHSALVLCDQMAAIFGAVEEAEVLRSKVQTIIHEFHDARISEEVEKLEKMLTSHKWVEAYQDAARLRRLFPESPRLHEIEQRIADVRIQYRHELESRFLQAAQLEDVEKAMKLLRELDGYLTPDEARRFRDTATEVISKYRDSLGARFKMAVSDRRWQEAIEFGEVIIQQFPNTKMTEEVQSMLETIRTRLVEGETSV